MSGLPTSRRSADGTAATRPASRIAPSRYRAQWSACLRGTMLSAILGPAPGLSRTVRRREGWAWDSRAFCAVSVSKLIRNATAFAPDFAAQNPGLRPAPPKPHLPLPGELPSSRSALRRTGRSATPDQVRGRLSPQAGEEYDCRCRGDFALDIRPPLRYKPMNLAHRRAPSAEGTPESGASAVPACGKIRSAPGQLRASC